MQSGHGNDTELYNADSRRKHSQRTRCLLDERKDSLRTRVRVCQQLRIASCLAPAWLSDNVPPLGTSCKCPHTFRASSDRPASIRHSRSLHCVTDLAPRKGSSFEFWHVTCQILMRRNMGSLATHICPLLALPLTLQSSQQRSRNSDWLGLCIVLPFLQPSPLF